MIPKSEVKFLVKDSRIFSQDFPLIRVEVLNCSLDSNKCKYIKLYQACKDRQVIAIKI